MTADEFIEACDAAAASAGLVGIEGLASVIGEGDTLPCRCRAYARAREDVPLIVACAWPEEDLPLPDFSTLPGLDEDEVVAFHEVALSDEGFALRTRFIDWWEGESVDALSIRAAFAEALWTEGANLQ